jgi:hypothetical protein
MIASVYEAEYKWVTIHPDKEESVVTITLPPEMERVVTAGAKRQGTTPELWALEKLNRSLQVEAAMEPASDPASEGGSMLDFFGGYVGVLHSSEFVPGGAHMSQDTGHKFAKGMLKKRQEGKL